VIPRSGDSLGQALRPAGWRAVCRGVQTDPGDRPQRGTGPVSRPRVGRWRRRRAAVDTRLVTSPITSRAGGQLARWWDVQGSVAGYSTPYGPCDGSLNGDETVEEAAGGAGDRAAAPPD